MRGEVFPIIRRALEGLLRDEGGQATVEYILLLLACVIAASQLGRRILDAIDSGIRFMGGQLEKDLKTGRAPLNVYK